MVLSVFLKFIFQHLRVRHRMRFFTQALNLQVDCLSGFSLIWSSNSIQFHTVYWLVFESTVSAKWCFDSLMWYFWNGKLDSLILWSIHSEQPQVESLSGRLHGGSNPVAPGVGTVPAASSCRAGPERHPALVTRKPTPPPVSPPWRSLSVCLRQEGLLPSLSRPSTTS